MSYADVLDNVFMALVDVGRREFAGSGTSALQHYKDCREVREESNKGALILAYKKDDFSDLYAREFISEEPEILGTYNMETLANFILEHTEDDYALLINPGGVVGLVEEINNNPPGMPKKRSVYEFMPNEILCRAKAGSRTKAAARAAVAGNGDIHTFVKKQSGPNPKLVVAFDESGAYR